MITSALLYLLYAIIYALTSPVRLLPMASLSPEITNAIVSAGGYVSTMNFIFPFTTFLTIFGIYLTIEGAILIWKIANWLIKKIPTIS